MIDIVRLQRILDKIDRQDPEKAAARREYERQLTEAWKKPPPWKSDVELLLTEWDAPIEVIAAVLRFQCAPRRVGKPFGLHLRWQQPHYLAAWWVERSSYFGGNTKDESISHWIKIINGWAFMRGRPPLDPELGSRDHERVKTLLRGSKRRRL